MLLGYARISSKTQSLEIQIETLTKHGCEKIYQEVISGKNKQRTELEQLIEYAREGDTIVVVKLDRLGRSLEHLIELMKLFEQRNINFISLGEQIDTSTPMGRLIFHLFGSIAEFERDLIRERCQIGLDAARARGKKGGRPKKMTEDKIKVAKALYADKSISVANICKQLGISRWTLNRYVNKLH